MARVYVGTYAKYNSGSIAGAWLDLEDFGDRESFLEACAKLHANEADPELMFQDYEGFPKAFYNESDVPAELWDWLELDEEDRELLAVYRDHVTDDATIDQARDAFYGKYDTEADWAASYWEDSGLLDSIPEALRYYIDYESYARDARCGGDMSFVRHDGDVWAFHNV